MKKTSLWLIAGVLAVGAISIAIHPVVSVAAPKAAPEMKVPGEAKGFAGTITVKVISTNDTENTFVVKVEKVVSVLKEYNKARRANALNGEKIKVYARWNLVAGTKTYKPDETQVKYLQSLTGGSKITIDVYSDAYSRIILTTAPKEPAGLTSR